MGLTGLVMGGAALVVTATPAHATTVCLAPNHKVAGCVVVTPAHAKGIGLGVAGSKGAVTADDAVGFTLTCGDGHLAFRYQYLKRSDGVSAAMPLCGL
jgi:hypothetical protein